MAQKVLSIAWTASQTNQTMIAMVPRIVYYLDYLQVKSMQTSKFTLHGSTSYQTIYANLSRCRLLHGLLLHYLERTSQLQTMHVEVHDRIPPLTWTACLSGGMMLREVEGARVQAVLLDGTVAMVTAADVVAVVVVVVVMAATVLLVSACFSPGLCLSISQLTPSQ